MSRSSEYQRLRERVDGLWDKYMDIRDDLDRCKEEKEKSELALYSVKAAPKLKRKGNFLIILGILLIVAEVFAVMYHSPFEPVDAVIIGVVLIWGLLRKRSGKREYREAMEKGGSVESLTTKIADLEAKINAYERIRSEHDMEQKKLDRMLRYNGKEWKLHNVRLTSSNIPALERDLNDLMFVLGRSNDEDYVLNNWFTLDQLEATVARISNNKAITDAADAARRQLGDSKSWILVATSIAMSTIELNTMRRGFKSGNPISFDEALGMSQARPAMTEEEKEYHENISMAVDNIGYYIWKKLKPMLE